MNGVAALNRCYSTETYFESINTSIEELRNKIAVIFLRAGSYLCDPICNVREYYYRIQFVDALNPADPLFFRSIQKVALCLQMIGWSCFSVLTTLPGIALRALGAHLMKDSFIYMQGESKDKVLPPNRSFSLLSWNICGVNAGYSISDGGVLPWAFRIDDILRKIAEKNPDVTCLYEIFDINTALYLCEKLKKSGYNHFYFHMGPKAIGVPSGIFVASKYKVQNPEFTPFPQDTLIGRTKNSTKGVFAFDIQAQDKNFARIYATHLQHSKEPQFPEKQEIEARDRQMHIILDKMKTVKDRCAIVTGDLNLDDAEYHASDWKHKLHKNDTFKDHKTWGGEECTAQLRPSCPLNLDHTARLKKTGLSIRTSLVETGFDRHVFQAGPLSDHGGLLSEIQAT